MEMRCKRCGSEHLIKSGFYHAKSHGIKRQNFKCKDCGYKFKSTKRFIVQEMRFVYKPKPVPPQNWPAYTQAQNQHKQGLMQLMKEMLDLVEIKQANIAGRPGHDLKEICFALSLKTFSRLSARRLHGELEMARQLGYIEKVPHFTVLMKHLRRKEMTLILKELLKLSALPIKQMKDCNTFSVDSTGFSTSMFGRWYDHYKEKEFNKREWLKCHAMVENKTNMVVNATITEGTAADTPRFERLVTDTSKTFKVKEVSADLGYISKKNIELVTKIGAKPFIPFKKNTSGKSDGSTIWRELFLFFKKHPQKFYEKYHKRSNCESSFSMIKLKLDSNLKTKTFTGQKNEILMRLIVHNSLCLLHEYFEKNINKYFDTQTPKTTIPLN